MLLNSLTEETIGVPSSRDLKSSMASSPQLPWRTFLRWKGGIAERLRGWGGRHPCHHPTLTQYFKSSFLNQISNFWHISGVFILWLYFIYYLLLAYMGTHYSVCTDEWRSEVKVTIFLYLHLIFNFLRMPLFMFYVDACFC